jgi:hypothetical protein
VTSPPNSLLAAAAALIFLTIDPALAVEEAEYEVVQTDGDIELRDYAPSIVAETVVEGDFEDAGNKAFRTLFKYIDGENRAQSEIAMTAPVAQQESSREIAMTAPVSQQAAGEGWVVSFMMPASYTMETIPEPLNPAVKIRQIPAYRAAAIRYSGFWSEKNYAEHRNELAEWLDKQRLRAAGPAVWARYNAPFVPWFMRRNEILIPVERE